MFSLADVFEIRQGQFINNKDTPDGQITVIKNGSKQYKKNIKSNLSSECIIITKMSIDVLYIEDFEKYYISSGAYILTIKKIYKQFFNLKYLYYIIKYKLIDGTYLRFPNPYNGDLNQVRGKSFVIEFEQTS